MTNNDNVLTRQLNRITLRALREKVKIQCAVVKQEIMDMETQLKENIVVDNQKTSTLNLKVSIRQH